MIEVKFIVYHRAIQHWEEHLDKLAESICSNND